MDTNWAEFKQAIASIAAASQDASQFLKNIDEMRAVATAANVEDRLDTHIGEPSSTQLAKIQQMTGIESDASEWLVVPYLASDNFVDKGYRRWHLSSLAQFAAGFVGRENILDHNWYEVDSGIGFIFDALLIQQDDCDEETLSGYNFGEYNRKILEKEGYCWLYLCAAIPAQSETADKIRKRIYNDCSTGSSLESPFMLCPNCSEQKGRDVSFWERDKNGDYVCPHLVPTKWGKTFVSMYGSGEPEPNWADYAVLGAAVNKPVEHSLCRSGALPAARIIREKIV